MANKLRAIFSGYWDASEAPETLAERSLECDAVILSVWTVQDDKLDTPKIQPAGGEFIFWGVKGTPAIQLFAGAAPFYIYVSNLKDISVRAAHTRQARIFYCCFKYVSEKEEK
jgi:hypothetical protein